MTRFFACLLALGLHGVAMAQSQTMAGFDIAFAGDFIQIKDPNGNITNPQTSSAFYGVAIRRYIDKHFYIEGGVYRKAHREGIAFANYYSATSTGIQSVMVPVRFGVSIPLLKKSVMISPEAGLTTGVTNEDYNIRAEGQFQEPGNKAYYFTYTLQYPSRIFFLVQMGANADIRLFRNTFLHLSSGYYGGLQKVIIEHISYSVDGNPLLPATIYNCSSFYTVGIGLRFAIGHAEPVK